MHLYATKAELAKYVEPDAETPPEVPNATVLLRTASGLVADAVNAAYAVDRDGLPTRSAVADALRDATLEMASAWHFAGIDPRKGPDQVSRRVASKSLGPASVSYVADPAADNYLSSLASGGSLVLAAWSILRRAGLVTSALRTVGLGGCGVPLRVDPFDPTTGELEPSL